MAVDTKKIHTPREPSQFCSRSKKKRKNSHIAFVAFPYFYIHESISLSLSLSTDYFSNVFFIFILQISPKYPILETKTHPHRPF